MSPSADQLSLSSILSQATHILAQKSPGVELGLNSRHSFPKSEAFAASTSNQCLLEAEFQLPRMALALPGQLGLPSHSQSPPARSRATASSSGSVLANTLRTGDPDPESCPHHEDFSARQSNLLLFPLFALLFYKHLILFYLTGKPAEGWVGLILLLAPPWPFLGRPHLEITGRS